MRGLKRDHSARVVMRGHALMQNIRRGHYELGIDAGAHPTRPHHLNAKRERQVRPHALIRIKSTVPARERSGIRGLGHLTSTC